MKGEVRNDVVHLLRKEATAETQGRSVQQSRMLRTRSEDRQSEVSEPARNEWREQNPETPYATRLWSKLRSLVGQPERESVKPPMNEKVGEHARALTEMPNGFQQTMLEQPIRDDLMCAHMDSLMDPHSVLITEPHLSLCMSCMATLMQERGITEGVCSYCGTADTEGHMLVGVRPFGEAPIVFYGMLCSECAKQEGLE